MPLPLLLPISCLARTPEARPCGARLARGLALLAAFMASAACLPAAAEGSSTSSTPSMGNTYDGSSYGGSSSYGSTSSSSSGASSSQGSWWAPGTGRSLIGLNVGRSRYHADCDSAFTCDNKDRYFTIYGRTMSDSWWGTEIGYVDMGRMERAGGDTRARGINLSLVGRAPVAEPFGLFGKVGVTWGHTSTGTAPGATVAGGSHNGFGLSLGAGVSWDFTPKLAGVLEWDRHDFRFEGGRDAVRATSVGLQYKY